MSNHLTHICWERNSADFNYETYDRTYMVKFSGGKCINASNPKEYFGDSELPNPEELLVSALSGCYMQTFLAIACKNGYVVDSYRDDAVGITDKNEHGKISIIEINLHPKLNFSGSKLPNTETIQKMRNKACDNCFISNSVNCKININITCSELDLT